MVIKKEELEKMMCYAMRYAIGRRTYAVSNVCEFYLERLYEWSNNCLMQAIKDIDSARSLGDPNIDMPKWLNLRKECYELLLSRVNYDKEKLNGIEKEYTGENLMENSFRK